MCWLALGTLLLLSEPAWATGEGFVRDLETTTAGACIGGKLKEHYFESGNIHGDNEQIEIACLNTPERATWVLISGRHCYGIKICPRMKRPAKPFASPAGHYVADQSDGEGSPRAMTYNLKQYAIGHDCELRSYKVDNYDSYYWACSSYETPYAEGGTTIRTTGPTKQVSDSEDNAPRLPLSVTLPSDGYDVDEVRAVIDPD